MTFAIGDTYDPPVDRDQHTAPVETDGAKLMDATRARRKEDRVRQIWYAHWRQLRFARFMGVVKGEPVAIAGWPTAGDYLICPPHGQSPIERGSCQFCGVEWNEARVAEAKPARQACPGSSGTPGYVAL